MAKISIPDQITHLTESGWFLYEICRCGGKLKHKYRNEQYPGIEVRWYPKLFGFTILDTNKTIVAMTAIGKLTQKLEEILHASAH